jgi:hypothetical protein
MPVVGDQTCPGFGVEFRIVQECELAKPLELAIASKESPREPIRNLDADKSLAARVSKKGMERAWWRCDCWPRRDAGRFTAAHVEEQLLVDEPCAEARDFDRPRATCI